MKAAVDLEVRGFMADLLSVSFFDAHWEGVVGRPRGICQFCSLVFDTFYKQTGEDV